MDKWEFIYSYDYYFMPFFTITLLALAIYVSLLLVAGPRACGRWANSALSIIHPHFSSPHVFHQKEYLLIF